MEQSEKTLDMIVNLCKNRGYVFPGSEIYGGLANSWDYGPLGVEFKNNVKKAWWQKFVQESKYNVGLDAAILMNREVWVASGHVGGFNDPLMDCKACKARFRADKLIEDEKVFIKGRVSAEEDKDAKLICEQITGFAEVPKTLWLKFPNLAEYTAKEPQTSAILKDSEGKDQIVIYLSDTRQMKKLPPNRNVNADQDLVVRLEQSFGKGNVKVVEKRIENIRRMK